MRGKFNFHKMDDISKHGYRHIAGGMSADVYHNPDKPNTVIMYTREYEKIQYMSFLGILVENHGYYMQGAYGSDGVYRGSKGRRLYCAELVRLEPINEDLYAGYEETSLGVNLREESDRFYKTFFFNNDWERIAPPIAYMSPREIKRLNPDDFPVHGVLIQFLQKFPEFIRRIRWDGHGGNYLQCPITGAIIPHDFVIFTFKRRW